MVLVILQSLFSVVELVQAADFDYVQLYLCLDNAIMQLRCLLPSVIQRPPREVILRGRYWAFFAAAIFSFSS